MRLKNYYIWLLWVLLAMAWVIHPEPARAMPACNRTISAHVVALDQVFFWNRYGAMQPQGMMFALRHDVVDGSGKTEAEGGILTAGNVSLRPGKRPRPLVLRMNVHDCLQIHFQNLLNPVRVDNQQPATRTASIHVIGMQLVNSILDDGSNVGANASSLVPPGDSITYTLYAEREGGHVLYSAAATTGGEGNGGSLNSGLFGAINVEPQGAEWYRSQVTEADLRLATTGTTPSGHPIIDYDAVYPVGHPRAGLPIFHMLQGSQIVHSDLTAIITGPGRENFTPNPYPDNPVLVPADWQAAGRSRAEPFREFTIIYHDEIGAVQAFPIFEDPVFEHTFAGVRDGFAINYGTGGLGAELLANRFGVGPVHDCPECKYEEFFLSSWTVGDPAMPVDVPANATDVSGNLITGPKATKALYPDDPSNVYHSYLGDHVKFRILHGGSKEHHIHHQHTHQWVYSPDSDNAAYIDSQAIGPGAAFTLEMVYNGSGNRNQAVGDSIFHCHFYPHFAEGMWSLWRVHDVLEVGTEMELDGDGFPIPKVGSRALPDGEIARGTPIPAVVPLPHLAMAPLPAPVSITNGQVAYGGNGNPGYPFFVPGIAGHRPPHPPMDKLVETSGFVHDGGLPRHIITDGNAFHIETRLDFTKELLTATAVQLDEEGEPVEKAAMAFHAQREHPSCRPDGTCDTAVDATTGVPGVRFTTNGLPEVAGAPFADPCVDDLGNPLGQRRVYKAADIQLDVVFNKAGWHFPQQRILALWGDVQAMLDGTQAPQPMFMRANTGDCIEYQLTNLVPSYYELDDFQVRTPTDVIGQHIHLVKFDVTASDGAANGFNYEDGSFSPDEVRERIRAIRATNACTGDEVNGGDPRDGTFACPVAKVHPYFGAGPNGKWIGAQTNIQRWYADDVLNLVGEDRTLRTVFTHDHFSPSTHQHPGLYAGLVIEPAGSTWRDAETGVIMGSRFDGGPTNWRADILAGPNGADSYREFLLEMGDFSLAYEANNNGFPDPAKVINPPAREEEPLPILVLKAEECPGGVPLPCPEIISAEDPGTMTVNYRNEPLALRVRDPLSNTQAAGLAGDLAFAFRSDIVRADPSLNVQPPIYPPLSGGLQPGDPFTPLMRAYERDKVQIRILIGAQEEGHNFSANGVKWLLEPDNVNSGYRNGQIMGISEHFEFELPRLPQNRLRTFMDYLYTAGSSTDDLWNGLWGILRSYRSAQPDLLPLPNNPAGGLQVTNPRDFSGVCPRTAYRRIYDITAVTAASALPSGTLVYNPRTVNGGPLHDPTAILYVHTADLDASGKLKAGVPVEPLILRAAAGDCILVRLRNSLPAEAPDLPGFGVLPMLIERFNNNEIRPSSHVGLHPQLVFYDVSRSDGNNVGLNKTQTASPGRSITYQWYAGELTQLDSGEVVATPIEFGATNLMPADRVKQPSKGAIGALIIEPAGSSWVEDATSRAVATVYDADGALLFREFVVIFQNDVNLRFADGSAIPNTADAEDPEDSAQKAVNYRTEPMWFRMGFEPGTPLSGGHGFTGTATGDLNFTHALSNALIGGDPATPVFTATAGTPVRFRVLHPGGKQRNNVFTVHGHIWQQEPYTDASTRIGHNPLSEWEGSRSGHGPGNHFDAVLQNGAGGKFQVSGDYLWRDFASFPFDGGIWGLFRVTPATP